MLKEAGINHWSVGVWGVDKDSLTVKPYTYFLQTLSGLNTLEKQITYCLNLAYPDLEYLET